MMKQVKRFASLLLVLIMTLAMMTVPAMAEQEGKLTDGSITIGNAVEKETYRIYQILYLESYNPNTGAYAYKANSAWENWLKTQTAYVSIDTQGYVTWRSGASEADFAKAALAYAQENDIGSDGKITADSDTVEFTGLRLGYYLVDSSLGVLCSLDTADPDAPISEKNVVPDVDKKVQEDTTDTYGDSNSAQIGDTVSFKTIITAKDGAKKYVLHDQMDAGLTFDGTVTVTVDYISSEKANYTAAAGTDYVLKVNSNDSTLPDGCTFEIEFTQAFLNKLITSDQIIVEYSATLNEQAQVGSDIKNTTKLVYGDNANVKTDETTTKTYQFEVLKYASNDSGKNSLAGAVFQLLGADQKVVNLIKISDTEYRVANGDETGAVESFITVSDQNIVIKGVDLDTYSLKELISPSGYNKLENPVTVVVNGGNPIVEVANNTGTQLPTTGGMGTTVFYVLGGALMLGAVVLFITKKRMNLSDK